MGKLEKEIAKQVFSKDFINKAKRKFEKAKDQMINQFVNHPVTKEIQAGPGAANSSGLLGGKGNLFSFIGFEKTHDPISPVTNALNQKSQIDQISSKALSGEIILEITISTPSEEDIDDVSKMPFESGRSWVSGIARGISGLGNFLSKKGVKASRSTGGIQTPKKIRAATFKRAPYLTSILSSLIPNFIKEMKR